MEKISQYQSFIDSFEQIDITIIDAFLDEEDNKTAVLVLNSQDLDQVLEIFHQILSPDNSIRMIDNHVENSWDYLTSVGVDVDSDGKEQLVVFQLIYMPVSDFTILNEKIPDVIEQIFIEEDVPLFNYLPSSMNN